MPDFLPRTPAELKTWADNFVNVTSGAPAYFGILAADVTAVATAAGVLGNKMVDKTNKETFFRAAVGGVNTADADLRTLIRGLVKHVQITSTVTDADRLHLMITVPDTVPTHHAPGTEVPTLEINVINNVVVIHFGTNAANENSNHFPTWAIGCNIYRRLHTETAFTLVNLDTASPYEDNVTWTAQEVQYEVAYRGRRATEVGVISQPVTVVCGHV